MNKTTKLKNKYILGEGYPWGAGKNFVGLAKNPVGIDFIDLQFPQLWSDLPEYRNVKYRLILEKVKIK